MFVASYRNTMAHARPCREEDRDAAELARRESEMADSLARLERLRQEADSAVRAANNALRKWHMSAELLTCKRPNPMSLDTLARRICRVFGVSRTELLSERRGKQIVFARHAFCYWAVRRSVRSMPQIGRWLGGRDHTTILHGKRAYVAKRAAQGRTLRGV